MNPALAPVTFQQIYVFLETVRENGFAKAGNKLHLTQSTISKNISRLEQTLGVPLFYRTTREIRLTPPGQELYDTWSALMPQFEACYEEAVRLQTQETSVLNLGVVNTVLPDVYLSEAMDIFHSRYPDKTLNLTTGHIWELEQNLMSGNCDAITLPDFEHYWAEQQGYTYRFVALSNASVLLSADHPLADRESLTTEDLLDCAFITFKHKHGNYCTTDLFERFAPYGRVPRISYHYESAHDMKYRFRRDHSSVIFLDSYFDFPQIPNIKRIPVTDQQNGIICVWNPKNTRDTLKKFLKYCIPETC